MAIGNAEERRHADIGEAVGEVCLNDIRELPRAKDLISTDLGLSEEAVFECRLAVTEAVANAFAHGHRDGRHYCRVWVERCRQGLRIVVEDRGTGFRWAGLQPHMPTPEWERGRGIHLMRLLTDALSIESTPNGTRIEMFKRLAAPAED